MDRYELGATIINTPSFTLGDGSVNDGYLHRDGIHLTHAAVNRLAKSLRLKKRNDASGVCSRERKPQYQHPHPPTALNHGGDAEWTTVRRRGRPAVSARRVSGSTRVSCHFCGEEGHSKDNCRHGRPIECHACHRPGHKSKLCLIRDTATRTMPNSIWLLLYVSLL